MFSVYGGIQKKQKIIELINKINKQTRSEHNYVQFLPDPIISCWYVK